MSYAANHGTEAIGDSADPTNPLDTIKRQLIEQYPGPPNAPPPPPQNASRPLTGVAYMDAIKNAVKNNLESAASGGKVEKPHSSENMDKLLNAGFGGFKDPMELDTKASMPVASMPVTSAGNSSVMQDYGISGSLVGRSGSADDDNCADLAGGGGEGGGSNNSWFDYHDAGFHGNRGSMDGMSKNNHGGADGMSGNNAGLDNSKKPSSNNTPTAFGAESHGDKSFMPPHGHNPPYPGMDHNQGYGGPYDNRGGPGNFDGYGNHQGGFDPFGNEFGNNGMGGPPHDPYGNGFGHPESFGRDFGNQNYGYNQNPNFGPGPQHHDFNQQYGHDHYGNGPPMHRGPPNNGFNNNMHGNMGNNQQYHAPPRPDSGLPPQGAPGLSMDGNSNANGGVKPNSSVPEGFHELYEFYMKNPDKIPKNM